MKLYMRAVFTTIFAAFLLFSLSASSQVSGGYDALVQKGKTQLQSGDPDQALASGEKAIKLNRERWEAYALAGGALMNLKRYEEASDSFSKAIERAPSDKQTSLRDLRKQCVLAEAGVAPPDSAESKATPVQNTPTATQAEVVLWKSIESSQRPSDFETYLQQYPNGVFTALAKTHLEQLRGHRKIAIVNLQAAVKETQSLQNAVVEAEARKQMLALLREYAETAHLDAICDVSGNNSPVLWASSETDITKRMIDDYVSKREHSNDFANFPSAKIGIINIQRAIVESAEGKRDFQVLSTKFDPKRAELESLNKEVGDLQTKLNAGGKHLSERARSDLEKQIDSKRTSLQRNYVDANNDIQAQQNRIANRIGEKMVQVLDKFAKASNYGVIFDSTSSAQNAQWLQEVTLDGSLRLEDLAGQDITLAIIEQYDKSFPAQASAADINPASQRAFMK